MQTWAQFSPRESLIDRARWWSPQTHCMYAVKCSLFEVGWVGPKDTDTAGNYTHDTKNSVSSPTFWWRWEIMNKRLKRKSTHSQMTRCSGQRAIVCLALVELASKSTQIYQISRRMAAVTKTLQEHERCTGRFPVQYLYQQGAIYNMLSSHAYFNIPNRCFRFSVSRQRV